MRQTLVAAAFSAAFLTSTASANTVGHCSGCEQFQAEEVAAAMPTAVGSTRVAVLDYARQFVWSCDVHREAGVFDATAVCLPAPSDAQAAFDVIAESVRELKTQTVRIPYPSGNIFDLSGCQSCVTNWLLASPHRVQNQMRLIDRLAANGVKLAGRLGVRFAEVEASYAGQVTIRFELENDDAAQNGRKAYCMGSITSSGVVSDPNQCFDSDGNPIPTHANPTLQIRYNFNSSNNFARFTGRLALMGRPVRGAGTVTVGGVIDCGTTECSARDGN